MVARKEFRWQRVSYFRKLRTRPENEEGAVDKSLLPFNIIMVLNLNLVINVA
jgi:hypothetical protein